MGDSTHVGPGSDQAVPVGPGGRGGARRHVELREDVAEMPLDCPLAEEELGGDSGVGLSDGHQAQHLDFSRWSDRATRREELPSTRRHGRHRALPRGPQRRLALRQTEIRPRRHRQARGRQGRSAPERARLGPEPRSLARPRGRGAGGPVQRQPRLGTGGQRRGPARQWLLVPRLRCRRRRAQARRRRLRLFGFPVARAISTCAGRSHARLRGSPVAPSTRRIDA